MIGLGETIDVVAEIEFVLGKELINRDGTGEIGLDGIPAMEKPGVIKMNMRQVTDMMR